MDELQEMQVAPTQKKQLWLLAALEDGGHHGGPPAGPVLGEHQVELVVGSHQLEIIQYNMYNLYNYIYISHDISY